MRKILHQPTACIMLFALVLLSLTSTATIHNVTVANFSFTPSVITDVMVGDTIRWQWVNGTHTTTSVTIPENAPAWNVSITSTNPVFDYRVIIDGSYTYDCAIHGSAMSGSFTVAPLTGVPVLGESSLNLNFFPNPVKENLGVSFNLLTAGTGDIKIYDLLGKLSKEVPIEAKAEKNIVSVPVEDLEKGIYIAVLYIGSRQLGIQRIIKN